MSQHILDHIPTGGKVVGEVAALGAIGGTLLDKLPAIAAGVAILWHCILFYDWARCKWENKKNKHRRKADNNNNEE